MAIPVSEINKTRILREIWLNPGISRIELAAALSLNKSSITKMIQELLEGGLVSQGGEGTPSPQGGRKPVGLELNPRYGVFTGLEINEGYFHLTVLDFSGKTVFSQCLDHTSLSEKPLLKTLKKGINSLIKAAKGQKIINMGVGLPGMVDCANGVLLRSSPLSIETPLPLQAALTELADFPIYIENDANCCCWGELAGRINNPEKNFLYVLGEIRENDTPGIGLGLALDGQVFRGPGFGAGEFRSILGNPDKTGQFSLPEVVLSRFFSDMEICCKIITELGRNIALVTNVLNLEKVFLGGFFHSFDPHWLDLIETEIHKNHSYPDTLGKLVQPALFDTEAVSLGAASLGMEKFFCLSGSYDTALTNEEL